MYGFCVRAVTRQSMLADVVAGDVVAQLLEVEAAAANVRGATAEEEAVDGLIVAEREAARLVLQRDQRIEFDVGSHRIESLVYATATSSTIRSMTLSALMPSACAS